MRLSAYFATPSWQHLGMLCMSLGLLAFIVHVTNAQDNLPPPNENDIVLVDNLDANAGLADLAQASSTEVNNGRVHTDMTVASSPASLTNTSAGPVVSHTGLNDDQPSDMLGSSPGVDNIMQAGVTNDAGGDIADSDYGFSLLSVIHHSPANAAEVTTSVAGFDEVILAARNTTPSLSSVLASSAIVTTNPAVPENLPAESFEDSGGLSNQEGQVRGLVTMAQLNLIQLAEVQAIVHLNMNVQAIA